MAGKPNLLLITTDTQRWDTLKCMGNEHAISPCIDKLASEGVMFTQAHTSSPVCMPARSCLMTGLHTPIHGGIENGTTRLTHFTTLPDLLKEQGYTNIMVGKTHFGEVPDTFDVVTGDEHGSYLKERGYDPQASHVHPTSVPEEHCLESYLVDRTIDEIEKVKGSGPFFAFCSMPAPHPPETPPGKWMTCYDDVPLPEINYVDGEEQRQPEHTKRLLGIEKENRTLEGESKTEVKYWREAIGRIIEKEHLDTIDQVRRLYYGFASYCDAQVGRLIDFLDRNGLRENTLVIFTSDHGQQYFDHGFNDKHNWYDASWRIPFVMSMPGTLPEGETRDFAIWNDITTTLLGAADTGCSTMQGFDLFTAVKNGEQSPRRCAIGTLYKSCAVATHNWKLEYYFEEGTGRLFDRQNDPLEREDLYANPAYSEVKNSLLHALLSWRGDIVDLKLLLEGTTKAKPDPDGHTKVSPRIAMNTRAMKGTDAEIRLGEKAELADLIGRD